MSEGFLCDSGINSKELLEGFWEYPTTISVISLNDFENISEELWNHLGRIWNHPNADKCYQKFKYNYLFWCLSPEIIEMYSKYRETYAKFAMNRTNFTLSS